MWGHKVHYRRVFEALAHPSPTGALSLARHPLELYTPGHTANGHIALTAWPQQHNTEIARYPPCVRRNSLRCDAEK